MRRMLALAVSVVLAVGGVATLTAAASLPNESTVTATLAAAGDAGTLDASGTAAIDDVRRCIASNKQLNVFYLIDASGSLFKDVDPVNATDPDFVRADILGNSLTQLAGLGNGVQVNYSAGFFGSSYKTATGWSSVTPETAAAASESLKQTIRTQPSLGFTDWGAGIAGAQDALATQHAANNGCQMMVWLTDGALNIRDDAAQNAAAINTLCGNAIDGSTQPAEGLGTFNALRQSGVVVVGVLLSVHPDGGEAVNTQYMRPLVESSGEVDGTAVTCGQSPPPSSSVNGALVEANDPSQLASVFAQLGVLINGGYPHPFDADGGFQVDPGVASFTIITSDPSWTLTPPQGSGLAAVSAASVDPSVVVTSTGGAIQIDVDVASAAQQGRWMLATPGGGDRQLFYYSGLTIVPGTGNQLVAGLAGAVSGQVATTTGRALVATDYSSLTVSVSKLPADGSAAQKIGDAVVSADGSFTLPYTPGADDGGAVDLVYSIDPLATALNQIALAAVSASQTVIVTVPANYPTVTPSALVLGALEGAKGSATGTLTLAAPADGSAGSVCFPSGATPTVVSDPANRVDTWQWSSSAELTGGCVALLPGQSVTVDLAASNPVAANSSVAAALPVALTSAAGESLPQTIAVTFDTTRPVNAAAFNVAVLLLILLGLLIALVVLWLMNFVTSGIAHGRQLLRASFPVTVDAENGVVGARGIDLMAATLDDFLYQPQLGTVKTLTDPELGTLRTHARLFQTRYEIQAPAGMRVFTVVSAGSRRVAVEQGTIAPMTDQLNRLWAVVVRDNDLLAGEPGSPIAGRLVVYKRNESNRADQFTDRMLDVTRDRTLWSRVARARVLLLEERGRGPAATAERGAGPAATAERGAPAPPPAPRASGTAAPPPVTPRRDPRDPPPPRR
ncbi:hypothetical protein [Subtercola boreus]|uniref:VWFA domain-containing protein n=2 Tax=Subtercola boreus TaxID=120213 RepID=A0A3E0WAH1_9MICO|nr:hypothetical protein [Subtercola boreus]RFA21006.1 hypothetical protein B7R24_06240 [Subtercola boreus]RFA21390.1 hypothetical protein B7R23_06185 [Subtercola boreus]RFA27361.1 hypothetical protein B7R25_06310 [Subtercola boreus]